MKIKYALSTIIAAASIYLFFFRPTIDPRAATYYQSYIDHIPNKCEYNNIQLSIKITDMDQNKAEYRAGNCQRNSLYGEISLDRKYWYEATPEQRYALVSHELGHCLFDAKHNRRNFMWSRIRATSYSELDEQINKFMEEQCNKSKST